MVDNDEYNDNIIKIPKLKEPLFSYTYPTLSEELRKNMEITMSFAKLQKPVIDAVSRVSFQASLFESMTFPDLSSSVAESMRQLTDTLNLTISSIPESLAGAINTMKISYDYSNMMSSISEGLELNSAFRLAGTVNKLDIPIPSDQSVEVSKEAIEEYYEISKQEEEKLDEAIPFNVYSTNYIFSAILPSYETLQFITDYGIASPGIAIIVFLLVTINLGVASNYKNSKEKTIKIEFEDEE